MRRKAYINRKVGCECVSRYVVI